MAAPALEIVQPVAQEGDVSIRHEDVAYSEPFSMVYNWTWDIPVSLVAHGLYGYLLHCCGQKGHMWHRQKTIATALHITEKTLRRYLDELEDHGLIRQENRQEKGLPSIIYIRTKDAVMRRQTLRENLPKVEPAVKVTAALGKNDRTLRENLPRNRTKRREQNEENKTKSEGAIPRRPASPAASLRWLKQYEPSVYDACMALKAEYVALSGQDANKYTDGDCEKLIRKCGDALPEASAAMHAVWDFHWRDGTHPYRRPLKLSKVLELLPAFRRGELTPETERPKRDKTPAHIQREHDYARNGEVDYSHEEQTPCCHVPVRFGHAYDCPHRAEGVSA